MYANNKGNGVKILLSLKFLCKSKTVLIQNTHFFFNVQLQYYMLGRYQVMLYFNVTCTTGLSFARIKRGLILKLKHIKSFIFSNK